jgi:hypothetical protein
MPTKLLIKEVDYYPPNEHGEPTDDRRVAFHVYCGTQIVASLDQRELAEKFIAMYRH